FATRAGSGSRSEGTTAATAPFSVSNTTTRPTSSGRRSSTAAIRSADRNRPLARKTSWGASRSSRKLWTSTLVRTGSVSQRTRIGLRPAATCRGPGTAAGILTSMPGREHDPATGPLLDVDPLAVELGERFAAAGFRLYLVGGSVRNLVLGR